MSALRYLGAAARGLQGAQKRALRGYTTGRQIGRGDAYYDLAKITTIQNRLASQQRMRQSRQLFPSQLNLSQTQADLSPEEMLARIAAIRAGGRRDEAMARYAEQHIPPEFGPGVQAEMAIVKEKQAEAQRDALKSQATRYNAGLGDKPISTKASNEDLDRLMTQIQIDYRDEREQERVWNASFAGTAPRTWRQQLLRAYGGPKAPEVRKTTGAKKGYMPAPLLDVGTPLAPAPGEKALRRMYGFPERGRVY